MMKKILFFILLASLSAIGNGQKIAFQKIDCEYYDSYSYLNDALARNLTSADLAVDKICNTDMQYMVNTSKVLKKISTSFLDIGYSFILVPKSKECNSLTSICTSSKSLNESNDIWTGVFLIYNLKKNKSKEVKLTIFTSGKSDLTLEACSNIKAFVKQVKEFVE